MAEKSVSSDRPSPRIQFCRILCVAGNRTKGVEGCTFASRKRGLEGSLPEIDSRLQRRSAEGGHTGHQTCPPCRRWAAPRAAISASCAPRMAHRRSRSRPSSSRPKRSSSCLVWTSMWRTGGGRPSSHSSVRSHPPHPFTHAQPIVMRLRAARAARLLRGRQGPAFPSIHARGPKAQVPDSDAHGRADCQAAQTQQDGHGDPTPVPVGTARWILLRHDARLSARGSASCAVFASRGLGEVCGGPRARTEREAAHLRAGERSHGGCRQGVADLSIRGHTVKLKERVRVRVLWVCAGDCGLRARGRAGRELRSAEDHTRQKLLQTHLFSTLLRRYNRTKHARHIYKHVCGCALAAATPAARQ